MRFIKILTLAFFLVHFSGLNVVFSEKDAGQIESASKPKEVTAGPALNKEDLKKEIRQELFSEIKATFDSQQQEINKLRQDLTERLDKVPEKSAEVELAPKAQELFSAAAQDIVKEALPRGEKELHLQECIDLSLSNSKEMAAVGEESNLARCKLAEAVRAFFPQANIEVSQTEGELMDNVSFIEKKYGIQFEHPVFDFGQTLYSFKQSKLQYEMAKKKVEKTKSDTSFRITEAFYELIETQLNLKYHEEAERDAEKCIKEAEAVFAKGYLTKEEILNSRSLYSQTQYQLISTKKDLELARIKLFHAMGIKDEEEQVKFGDAAASIDFAPSKIDIDEVVDLALSNRPDIEITRMSAQAHGYDELVQRRKNWPKITLSGFGGKSASYYTTESENFKNDWNIGVKFSVGLGPNTLSSIYTKEETSPELGMDSRTSTDMLSLKMGILDNLNSYTKISEAKVGRLRAEDELDQMEREVMMEAKQAFFDYQGSILRIKNTMEKTEYLNQVLVDTELKVRMGKLPVSQLMDAKLKLADQKGLYVQALCDGFVALAKLDKVTGRPGFYTNVIPSADQAKEVAMEEILRQEEQKKLASQ